MQRYQQTAESPSGQITTRERRAGRDSGGGKKQGSKLLLCEVSTDLPGISKLSPPPPPPFPPTTPRTPGDLGSGTPDIYRALAETQSVSVCSGPAGHCALPCPWQRPPGQKIESQRSGLRISCLKPGVPRSVLCTPQCREPVGPHTLCWKGVRQQGELWPLVPPLHGPGEGLIVGGRAPQGLSQRHSASCGGCARAVAQPGARPARFSLTIFTSNFPLHTFRGPCPVRSWRTVFPPSSLSNC